jgi:hypothetical protein
MDAGARLIYRSTLNERKVYKASELHWRCGNKRRPMKAQSKVFWLFETI